MGASGDWGWGIESFQGLFKELGHVPIPGNTNYAILRNLQPDAPYTITVVPDYPEGNGGCTADTGRIWKCKKYVLVFLSSVVRGLARNVQVYSLTTNSLDIRWTPPRASAATSRLCAPLAGTGALEP
ncbi:Collagen alpha-1 chain, partial [Camelus dromedarius]